MISHKRNTLCDHTCCVYGVGTGACMYACACNVKASPPLRTQIYGAEIWQTDREQEEVEGGGDRSKESGTRVREGGEAQKICGRVQGKYAREGDNSGEMDDLIKTGRIDIFQDRRVKEYFSKRQGGCCYPRVLHLIRIKWCELIGGLEC